MPKKDLFSCFLTITLLLSMSACAGGGNEGSGSETVSPLGDGGEIQVKVQDSAADFKPLADAFGQDALVLQQQATDYGFNPAAPTIESFHQFALNTFLKPSFEDSVVRTYENFNTLISPNPTHAEVAQALEDVTGENGEFFLEVKKAAALVGLEFDYANYESPAPDYSFTNHEGLVEAFDKMQLMDGYFGDLFDEHIENAPVTLQEQFGVLIGTRLVKSNQKTYVLLFEVTRNNNQPGEFNQISVVQLGDSENAGEPQIQPQNPQTPNNPNGWGTQTPGNSGNQNQWGQNQNSEPENSLQTSQ